MGRILGPVKPNALNLHGPDQVTPPTFARTDATAQPLQVLSTDLCRHCFTQASGMRSEMHHDAWVDWRRQPTVAKSRACVRP
eukprot:887559-Rhodomonas_salina.1